MIEVINTILREGEKYSVEDVAKKAGVSTPLAARCLRSLWRGGLCERELIDVGETKAGKSKQKYFYQTKQKDLPI